MYKNHFRFTGDLTSSFAFDSVFGADRNFSQLNQPVMLAKPGQNDTPIVGFDINVFSTEATLAVTFVSVNSDSKFLFTGPNDDHSDTQSGATVIAVGETLAGIINAPDDIDYFTITLTAGDTIEINLGDNNTFADIIGTDGLGDGSFFGGSAFSYTAEQTGAHFIAVQGADQDTYSLSITATEPDIPGDTSTTEVLILDGSVSSISNGNGDEDWFVFNANAGEEVLFELDIDNLFSNILIYDSAGQQVGGLSVLFNTTLEFLFETTDTYYIAAILGGDNGAPFTLSAVTTPDDFSETIDTTGDVSLATDASGVIEFAYDSDWFEFSGTAGQLLAFTIDPSSEELGLGLRFYDSTGTELSIGEPVITNENGVLTYHLDIATSGTYYASVESGPVDTPGSYNLGLDIRSFPDVAGNDTTTANLTIGTTFVGDIFADNDADYIRVNLVAGETYLLSEYFASGGTNLINFVGGPISFTDFYSGADFDQYLITPEVSGTFYLALVNSGLPNNTTDWGYTIESETIPDDHGDSDAEATPVNPLQGFSGVNEYSRDTDWFTFTLSEDEDILFTNNDNVLFYNFYDSSGNIVGNTSYGILADVAPGTYFVEVLSSFNRDEGLLNSIPYSMQAERIYDEAPGDTSTTVTISEGQTRVGALSSDTDQDWYTIEVNAGDVVTFNAVDQSDIPLSYTLYDSNGVDQGAITSGTYEITFNVGGQYYVGVSQTSVAYGEYSLTWFGNGTPTFLGSGFDDVIEGGSLSSDIFTLGGQDIISAQGGNDTISTGVGRDIVIFSQGDGADIVTDFNVQMDRISLSLPSSSTLTQIQTLMVQSGGGVVITLADGSTLRLDGLQISDFQLDNFILTGPDFTEGDDNYIGTSANDILNALGGNDIVNGLSGDDIIDGGIGDDTLIGGLGADTLDGGAGFDTANYSNSASGVTIRLFNNENTGGDAQGDILSGIEAIEGSAFADVLIGSSTQGDTLRGAAGNDLLFGLAGDDILIGGAGADTLDGGASLNDVADYSESSAGVTVRLFNGTGVGGDAQGDVISNIESVIGSNFADVLIGSSTGVDVLNGGLGDDLLFGLAGNDTLIGGAGADTLDGGASLGDTADYSDSGSGVTVRLFNGTGAGGDAQGDMISNIEGVIGSAFNDVLIGSSTGVDTLQGGSGDDALFGLAGNDILIGGAGADTLDGGASLFDVADYSGASTGVAIRLFNGTGTGGDAQGDTLTNIEVVEGSAFNDTLIGSSTQIDTLIGGAGDDALFGLAGNDTLIGGAGADMLDGGASNADTADYSDSEAGVVVRLFNGTGLGGDAQGDTLVNIEGVRGSAFNDTLIGSSTQTDILRGQDGIDSLFGLAGNDILDGGNGNDSLTGGAGNDLFVFADGFGQDTITDFTDGLDRFDVSGIAGVTSIADFTITQEGADVLITLDANNTITLENTLLADIDANDFVF